MTRKNPPEERGQECEESHSRLSGQFKHGDQQQGMLYCWYNAREGTLCDRISLSCHAKELGLDPVADWNC